MQEQTSVQEEVEGCRVKVVTRSEDGGGRQGSALKEASLRPPQRKRHLRQSECEQDRAVGKLGYLKRRVMNPVGVEQAGSVNLGQIREDLACWANELGFFSGDIGALLKGL